MDVKNEAEMILKLALKKIGEKEHRVEGSFRKSQGNLAVACGPYEEESESLGEIEYHGLFSNEPKTRMDCNSKLEIINTLGKEKARIHSLSSIIIMASLLCTSALFIWLTW